jgi:peptide/nickel transport system ATP-binding protein
VSLLEIEQLRVTYGSGSGALHAVDGVDMSLAAGKTLGLIGESGSGKSTLAKAIVGLAPIREGILRFDGEDVRRPSGRRLKRLRRRIQLVFQDPYSSLNPRLTIGESIDEPLLTHRELSRAERGREVGRLLDLVGLAETDRRLYPFQFSGGQRQRIAIARALAVQPELIIADEITSALDVSVQASILNLLRDLQLETGVTLLVVSHNLAVVGYLADEIAVMHLGKIVEVGPATGLFRHPRHPYTNVLIDSVPRLHRRGGPSVPVVGELPDPHHPPSGCRFHTRCPVGPLADPGRGLCRTSDPHTDACTRPHSAACHYVPSGDTSRTTTTGGPE